MKKLLLLLSVASLVNAMEDKTEQRQQEQKQELQAPRVMTMDDYVSDRDFNCKEWAEYVADCGCLTPIIEGPGTIPTIFIDYPRVTSFCAGFVSAQLCNYLPTWASITGALGAVATYKLL